MLSIVADLKWFYERFSAYTHPNLHEFNILWGIMIESKLIPRFRSLWCHQRPGKLTTALGLRPRAVVSFPGRWWHHNDLNLGINSYNHPHWRIFFNSGCWCILIFRWRQTLWNYYTPRTTKLLGVKVGVILVSLVRPSVCPSVPRFSLLAKLWQVYRGY